MVVLLIVAISTATFAWFSASNVVNIASLTFTASSRSGGGEEGDSSGALKLSWVGENATEEDLKGAIALFSGTEMKPMIPRYAPTVDTTYEQFVGDGSFYSATQSTAGDVTIYASNPFAVTPYTCLKYDGNTHSVDPYTNTFYVYNTGSFTMEVTMGWDMDDHNASALRVAVFADNKYVATMRQGDLHYGLITRNAVVTEQDKIDYVEDEEIRFYVPANSAVPVNLVAWFDGVVINDSGAQRKAGLNNITFRGAFIS